MFGRKKRGKSSKILYNSIRLIYFGRPVDEQVSMAVNREDMTLELSWDGDIYVMALDRLEVSYYHDMYASLLAQGEGTFGDDWPAVHELLVREQELRSRKNEIKNRDGLKLTYRTKDGVRLVCVVTSEVLLYMSGIYEELNQCKGGSRPNRIEL